MPIALRRYTGSRLDALKKAWPCYEVSGIMTLPPMLLAAVVMFWGWQCGQWWLAAAVAVLLEAPRIIAVRFHFSLIDLNRIANFCTLSFVVVAALLVFSDGAAQAVVSTLQWMPLIVLPLFLAMAYGGLQKIDLSVISTSLRRRAKNDADAVQSADLGYPYFALWLLAASLANQSGQGFYLGLLGLCVCAMWCNRPAGRSSMVWGSAILIAATGGGLISTGLYRLQNALEEIAINWMTDEGDEDPNRTHTSLGHVGKLQLSDFVALRIATPPAPALQLPLLLRTASYNVFSSPSWLVPSDTAFHDLVQDAKQDPAQESKQDSRLNPQSTPATGWQLDQSGQAGATIEVSASSTHAKVLIALPDGTVRVDARPFTRLKRNRFGTIQAELAPGHYSYRATYRSAFADQAMPTEDDLKLPPGDRALLLRVAGQLQLPGKPPEAILKSVMYYFAGNFSYNTVRSGNASGQTALSDFLIRNRSGHCEHFATATVMLLRAAGIPARYAVGFSVQERSRFGSGYIARHRDAHAWTQVWVNGAWRDFDTTPPAWSGLAQGSGTAWESLLDAWSWLVLQAHKMQFSRHEFFAWGIGLLGLIWFGPRLIRGISDLILIVQRRKKPGAKLPQTQAEDPSEFYRIEHILAERGLARPHHEPLTVWSDRITPQIGDEAAACLIRIVHLHYRWRFGPQPLRIEERESLRSASCAWLEDFGKENGVENAVRRSR